MLYAPVLLAAMTWVVARRNPLLAGFIGLLAIGLLTVAVYTEGWSKLTALAIFSVLAQLGAAVLILRGRRARA